MATLEDRIAAIDSKLQVVLDKEKEAQNKIEAQKKKLDAQKKNLLKQQKFIEKEAQNKRVLLVGEAMLDAVTKNVLSKELFNQIMSDYITNDEDKQLFNFSTDEANQTSI